MLLIFHVFTLRNINNSWDKLRLNLYEIHDELSKQILAKQITAIFPFIREMNLLEKSIRIKSFQIKSFNRFIKSILLKRLAEFLELYSIEKHLPPDKTIKFYRMKFHNEEYNFISTDKSLTHIISTKGWLSSFFFFSSPLRLKFSE